MRVRTRIGWLSTVATLMVAVAVLVVLGDHTQPAPGAPRAAADGGATTAPAPTTGAAPTTAGNPVERTATGSASAEVGSTTTAPSSPSRSAGPTPAWLHRLAPGERPPQFVLFSFDGAGDHAHWQRMLPLARRVGAHFSGFLSGIYLLDDARRGEYTGPGHLPGRASIGFGGSPQEVRTRIEDLNTAIADGHEIGTHYNGHFCRGAEPSVGFWQTAQWNAELDQFFGFVRQATGAGLRVDPATIRGGRTPCLEGRFEQLFPALRHLLRGRPVAAAAGPGRAGRAPGVAARPRLTGRVGGYPSVAP
ncbi:hypothetical protein [Gandjariella thermophila]|uniref:NodB homology domain-containing protein n=1 Tax=Gandjariella thermophila TaxID=1931992 RepID=A0A4D4J380_9PSEU|nr:hypothetical protein [Gandjariella thermophila]GDY29904.1 hypothetical protein GTS_15370 [Gandjariella thermophila]